MDLSCPDAWLHITPLIMFISTLPNMGTKKLLAACILDIDLGIFRIFSDITKFFRTSLTQTVRRTMANNDF